MRVEFRKGGLLGEVLVVRSSGHQVLDEQAREMVRSAELPPVAAELRNRDFSINVPVVFRLN
jgi:TonB family protein